jgi:hypothetical protein
MEFFMFPKPAGFSSCDRILASCVLSTLSASIMCAAPSFADDPDCDERFELSCNDVLKFPDRLIGLLRSDKDNILGNNNESRGTGFLIGPHTVLTSGHCVFERSLGSFENVATFSPATCMRASGAVSSQLGVRTSSRLDVLLKYMLPGTTFPYKYDLGAMNFVCPFDQFDTFMPVVYNYDPAFARLGGYPGFTPDDPQAQIPDPSRNQAPWRSFGETDYEGGRVVKFKAKGSKGQSGSPVMAFGFDGSEQTVQAFAVHSTGFWNAVECDRSGGPKFTDKTRDQMEAWMNYRPSEEERKAAGCPSGNQQSTLNWWELVVLYGKNKNWLLDPDDLQLIDPPGGEPMGPSPYQIMQVIENGFYDFAVFQMDPNDPFSPRFIQLLSAPGMPDQQRWEPGMPWIPGEIGFISAYEALILFSASMDRNQFEFFPVSGGDDGQFFDNLALFELPILPDDLDTSDDPQEDEYDQSYHSYGCLADIDFNGQVNGADLSRILGAWGDSSGLADINRDGVVGAEDLALLLGAYGACP